MDLPRQGKGPHPKPPGGREGPQLEWKQRLPRGDRIASTLAAFANGVGGVLLIGVDDGGHAVGIGNPREVQAELERVAATCLEPPIELRFHRRRLHEVTVLEVRVRPADGPTPVRVLLRDGRKRVYVRDGSSSRPAARNEVRFLCRRSSRRARLDERSLRLLEAVRAASPPTLRRVAKAARVGPRTAQRILRRLAGEGLLMEKPGRRLWITPAGYAELERARNKKHGRAG